jgi:hypothetical protein
VQSTPESKIPPHGSFALYILNAASWQKNALICLYCAGVDVSSVHVTHR